VGKLEPYFTQFQVNYGICAVILTNRMSIIRLYKRLGKRRLSAHKPVYSVLSTTLQTGYTYLKVLVSKCILVNIERFI